MDVKEDVKFEGYEKFGDMKKLDWSSLVKYREFILEVAIQKAKLELLSDFKKANPYYYSKIDECSDFKKVIKKLHLSTQASPKKAQSYNKCFTATPKASPKSCFKKVKLGSLVPKSWQNLTKEEHDMEVFIRKTP